MRALFAEPDSERPFPSYLLFTFYCPLSPRAPFLAELVATINSRKG